MVTQHTPYLFGQLLYWFEYLRTTQMLGRLGTTPCHSPRPLPPRWRRGPFVQPFVPCDFHYQRFSPVQNNTYSWRRGE